MPCLQIALSSRATFRNVWASVTNLQISSQLSIEIVILVNNSNSIYSTFSMYIIHIMHVNAAQSCDTECTGGSLIFSCILYTHCRQRAWKPLVSCCTSESAPAAKGTAPPAPANKFTSYRNSSSSLRPIAVFLPAQEELWKTTPPAHLTHIKCFIVVGTAPKRWSSSKYKLRND